MCVVYAGVPFSSVVLDAKNKGYTEPDPREDLSGAFETHTHTHTYTRADTPTCAHPRAQSHMHIRTTSNAGAPPACGST